MALSIQPCSEIFGSVGTNGSVGGPAFVQLLNPKTSIRVLVVREIRVGDNLTGVPLRMRRTKSPNDVNGAGSTVVTGTVKRKDGRSTRGIQAQLYATNFTASGVTFTSDQSQWYEPTLVPPGTQAILRPHAFWHSAPISVIPGSALEFATFSTGSGSRIQIYLAWDEEDQ